MLSEEERKQLKDATIDFGVSFINAIKSTGHLVSLSEDEGVAVWHVFGAVVTNYLEVIARPKKQTHESLTDKSADKIERNKNTVVTE